MQNSMIIDIMRIKQRIKKNIITGQSYLFGDFQQIKEEESMSPRFAGILNTKTCLLLDMVLMTSLRKLLV